MTEVHRAFITLIEDGKKRLFNLHNEMFIGHSSDDNSKISVESDGLSQTLDCFHFQDDMWIYENLSEECECLVGKHKLDPYKAVILSKHPEIQIISRNRKENLKIVFSMGNATPPSFDADDRLLVRINKRVGKDKGKERILIKDINLDIFPNEMVLVLGGSGAGKTTFVNAVSGYERADATIIYKGTDLYADEEKNRKLVRMVPQFDTLRDEDTVFNTLRDVAIIQLPHLFSDQTKLDKKVMDVLEVFGLEKEQTNFVKKLSGGQRKRLSIATEYISEPEIFFLDEPDSGLDAASAVSVMEKVREIVDEGKVSIIISHSPNRVAKMFDKVLVIAKDSKENCGQMAFYGKVDEAYDFFEVDSLEAIVKEINIPERADYFIKKFKGGNDGSE